MSSRAARAASLTAGAATVWPYRLLQARDGLSQLKAVCVEAGMLALRRDATEIHHEDFVEGITAVQTKKKASLAYYA